MSRTTASFSRSIIRLYERFVELLEARHPGKVATGEFGAMMDVSLTNDGPVTLVIDR